MFVQHPRALSCWQVELLDLPLVPQALEVATRYADFAPLGRGGHADVWSCFDVLLGRHVAYKVLRAEWASDPRQEQLLVREARILASLAHPAIPPVYDLGRDGQGRPFFTLPIVRGVGLDSLIRMWTNARRPVEPDVELQRRVALWLRAAEAVAWAHQQGWVHGDIKPANVLVAERDEVVLIDWGLASPAAVGEAVEASRADRIGSPGYVAPELLGPEPQAPSKRSDVYQLGAVLYELLTLAPLHEGLAAADLLRDSMRPAKLGPRQRSPWAGITPELEATCLRAIASDPAKRFANAGQFARALRDAHLDLLVLLDRDAAN